MITGCATSGTDAGSRRAALVAAALLAAAPAFAAAASPPLPAAPATAAGTADLMTPADLRDRFEKCLKTLRKAEDATGGRDAGRVSLLLRRADEDIAEYAAGAGIDPFVTALAASRAAAGAGDLQAAGASLRRAREVLRSLADYSVARAAEVAYRSALSAIDDGNPHDFVAAADRFDAAVRAGYLADRLGEARAAIARGRAAMVKRDMPGGGKEVAAARAALGRMDYAASLAQARQSLLLASELLRENAFLTAREQSRTGLRAVRAARGRAPAADVETLEAVETATTDVWRRLSKPEPGDPARLEESADRIETLRRQLR